MDYTLNGINVYSEAVTGDEAAIVTAPAKAFLGWIYPTPNATLSGWSSFGPSVPGVMRPLANQRSPLGAE